MPSDECEFPKFNATTSEVRELLSKARTIAVVGLSPKEDRPSHRIALYLKDAGYKVIGVNPGQKEIFGENVYARVSDIPEEIDIVDIFLRPENIPPVVEDAIAKKAKAVWMQQGIVNNAAAERARAAGLTVIMNKCISVEHAGAGL